MIINFIKQFKIDEEECESSHNYKASKKQKMKQKRVNAQFMKF